MSAQALPTALRHFYAGKSVLVTGHTGFKGAWLSLWLAELGARVYGYALPPPTEPSLFRDLNLPAHLAGHRIGDVRNLEALTSFVQEARPEIVFHLAAQPLVRRSYREPRETFETNVMGVVNILEAVRAVPTVKVCEVISSDKCYENRGGSRGYQETDPLGGADPYSASKGCTELVVAAYRRSFFSTAARPERSVSLSSARAGNVIGGGDWAEDRIIPDCIRALQRGEPLRVRNPNAIRPWQHVLEPLCGYLLLAMRQFQNPHEFAEGFNFGPNANDSRTVCEIIELALEHWGTGSWIDESNCAQVHEAAALTLDVAKAATVLGWRPQFSVDEAVSTTVRWYRDRQTAAAFDARALCIEQILAYEERIKASAPRAAGERTRT